MYRLKPLRGTLLVPMSIGIVFVCVCAIVGCNVGRTAAKVGSATKLFLFAQGLGPTPTQSVGEHMHDMSAVIDQDTRVFLYDFDMLYQTDRPTRLTRWHSR